MPCPCEEHTPHRVSQEVKNEEDVVAASERCQWEQHADGVFVCRKCGRSIKVLVKRSDGTFVEPRWESMPPCGWRGLRQKVGGHLWVETWQSDNKRRLFCARCTRRLELEADADDSVAIRLMAQEPPCVPQKPEHISNAVWLRSLAFAEEALEPKGIRTEESLQRVARICQQCEHYDSEWQLCKLFQCRNEQEASVWRRYMQLKLAACPLEKWGKDA